MASFDDTRESLSNLLSHFRYLLYPLSHHLLRLKRKLVNAHWILLVSFRDRGLQCKGAAGMGSSITAIAGGSRVTTAEQLCWPACGAREGWRELFYPFSVTSCQVIVHGQVSFHNSLQIIWYLIRVACFALKRFYMLQDCQLWSQSVAKSIPFRVAD